MTIDNSLNSNSWLISESEGVVFDGFRIIISKSVGDPSSILTTDALVMYSDKTRQWFAAKIFVIELTETHYKIYLKGIQQLNLASIEKLQGLDQTPSILKRLEWAIFEEILLRSGCSWDNFPLYNGSNKAEQAYLRELLQLACERDLLGPAGGPEEEIIGMSVRDRYLIGKLAPRLNGGTNVEGMGGQTVVEENEDDKEEHILGHHHAGEEFADVDVKGGTDDDENPEANTVSNQSLVPSSLGFTFCVDSDVKEVEAEVSWGKYIRSVSERNNPRTGNPFRCWKRKPVRNVIRISLEKVIPPSVIHDDSDDVYITGSVNFDKSGKQKLVTLFLVNNQSLESDEKNQDAKWLFQPEMIVRDLHKKPIFRKRPFNIPQDLDPELSNLEMIYRRQVEFAVGHGVSVHAKHYESDPEVTDEIRTVVLPTYEVPVTETPGLDVNDRPLMKEFVEKELLDMSKLSSMDRGPLGEILTAMIDDYGVWIEEGKLKATSLNSHRMAAAAALENCAQVKERLKKGVNVLMTDPNALEAFRFANKAMALQRVHSIFSLKRRRGENVTLADIDVPSNRSWRAFQIAFILLSIPGLADPTSEDRGNAENAVADLLWFPTGGGKTEAYLGVAAFAMAIRRLHGMMGERDASRGLAVIMRYTLRLLTIQQFQRATTLICAMELLRAQDTKWDAEPFRIGLWVGSKTTPNTAKAAEESIRSERDGTFRPTALPYQLTHCPWCGTEIEPGRDLKFNNITESTHLFCGEKKGRCEFTNANSEIGLPVVVVDEELYRKPPSMLIATVDKFALVAWKGAVKNLFGKGNLECIRHGLIWPDSRCNGTHQKKNAMPSSRPRAIVPFRPPDLIIQDELHLISGPLGTMVGLYEATLDKLCTWEINGKKIKPKIIASTATVRKAAEQVNNLFMRKVCIFPPSGIDVEDNFFSIQRPNSTKPGRRYLGICSPGSSRPSVLIRVYTALLTASQELFNVFGQAADPYMTLVGYFNSLRELGGMRRLTEDDVRTRAFRVQMSDVYRPGLAQRSIKEPTRELTSRVPNKEIPHTLDQLEVKFKKDRKKNEEMAIDIVLATNMLSVGVDVNRLGLMVVNGQPKNVSEYIQATSRVGRLFPGLVCTVLTWARPRDLSHYETFEHFHSTFYKHVEAQSVTPFSARALDRGLSGTMIGIMRGEFNNLSANLGAGDIANLNKEKIGQIRDELGDRAWRVKSKESMALTIEMIEERFDSWKKAASKGGRRLAFEAVANQGDVFPLLEKPSDRQWSKWTIPYSMREVEPGVRLVMKTNHIEETPDWQPYQDPTREQLQNE